jgi:hypothetical protein
VTLDSSSLAVAEQRPRALGTHTAALPSHAEFVITATQPCAGADFALSVMLTLRRRHGPQIDYGTSSSVRSPGVVATLYRTRGIPLPAPHARD